MIDGLNIVCSPGGYYPYVVVAWCRVVDGWVRYAPGARVIRRFGGYGQLAKLAVNGPMNTTQLLEPSVRGGGCSTSQVCRYEVCNPAAWVDHCPKPAGWDDGNGG